MPDWSGIQGSNRFETIGADTSITDGTQLNTSADDTKGNYVELVASTAFNATGFWVHAVLPGISDALIDIAVGASGSEQIIISDILHYSRDQGISSMHFPIPIPAGTRIAARAQQSSYLSGAPFVTVLLESQPFLPGSPLSRCTTYGANTVDSGGTGVDPGGVADTKGGYSQVTGSTTNNIRSLLIRMGARANAGAAAADFLLDVAVGAAGSEQVILSDLWFMTSSVEAVIPAQLGPYQVNIPAGTRLAVQAQSSSIDAADRLIDVVLYGMD